METNMDQRISRENLADVAGLSVSHFAHQFRRSANARPYRYLLRRRIERGKRLLDNSKLSILDVALAVGFENHQHFTTAFRQVAGKSPSNYRHQL
jgi:AraC family transcriptional regulator